MTPASAPEPVREDTLRKAIVATIMMALTRAGIVPFAPPGLWEGVADALVAGPLAEHECRLAEVERRRSAEVFARRAHANQTDKAGLPYAGHLGRVAARARAHAEAISAEPEFAALCEQAGWLHDVVEDTPFTAEHLRLAGFDPAVVSAVERLTHLGDTPYLDYVRSIIASGDPIAMVVKLADNEDNIDWLRPSTPLVSSSLLERYRRSRDLLRAALVSTPTVPEQRGEPERQEVPDAE